MFDGPESAPHAPFFAMAKKQISPAASRLPAEDQARAARCRLLREQLGYAQSAAFAAFLGVSPQRWNHVENGKPLGHELAIRLVQAAPGVTLDWLYFGKPDGLPLEWARRLGELGPVGKRNTA
jgi:DNA-binding XRE family transcriptional regulator